MSSSHECRNALALWITNDNRNKLQNFNAYNNAHSLPACDKIFKSTADIWPGTGQEILLNEMNWRMCHKKKVVSARKDCIWDYHNSLGRQLIQPMVASAVLELSQHELKHIKEIFKNI